MSEAIRTRCSIRSFTDEPASQDTCWRQPCVSPVPTIASSGIFVVIRDREMLRKVEEGHPYAKMAAGAAVAVIICADLNEENPPDSGSRIARQPRRISCWRRVP